MNGKAEISERRLLFLAALVIVFLAIGSFRFNDWRVTSGVILGGALSFLNLYWLKTSIKSLLGQAADGETAKFSSAFYVLRYLIIASVVAVAVILGFVSVAATIVGLLSFAFAILLESLIQLYFVIVNREED